MKLSVKQRLLLLQNLPQSGNELEMIAISQILKKVDFLGDELQEVSFKDEPNGLRTWNAHHPDKQIKFDASEASILKDMRTNLDRDKRITIDLLPLMLEIKKL